MLPTYKRFRSQSSDTIQERLEMRSRLGRKKFRTQSPPYGKWRNPATQIPQP